MIYDLWVSRGRGESGTGGKRRERRADRVVFGSSEVRLTVQATRVTPAYQAEAQGEEVSYEEEYYEAAVGMNAVILQDMVTDGGPFNGGKSYCLLWDTFKFLAQISCFFSLEQRIFEFIQYFSCS